MPNYNKIIKFPDNKINTDLFLNKTYLSNISEIDTYAFSNNPTLSNIYIPKYLSRIGNNAFNMSYNAALYIDQNKYNSPLLSNQNNYGLNLDKINYLEPNNMFYTYTYKYTSIGGYEFSDQEHTITFKYRLITDEITNNLYVEIMGITNPIDDSILSDSKFCLFIPSEINGIPVESIGIGAFQGYTINHIELPTSLKHIQHYAFRNLRFSTETSSNYVSIPSSVIDIQSGAFDGSNIYKFYFNCIANIPPTNTPGNIILTTYTNFNLNANNLSTFYKEVSCNLSNLYDGEAFINCNSLNAIEYAWMYNSSDLSAPIWVHSGPGYVVSNGKFAIFSYNNSKTLSCYKGTTSADTRISACCLLYEISNTGDFKLIKCENLRSNNNAYCSLPTEIVQHILSSATSTTNFIGYGNNTFQKDNTTDDVIKANALTSINYISTLTAINGNAFFDSTLYDIRLQSRDDDISENSQYYINNRNNYCIQQIIYCLPFTGTNNYAIQTYRCTIHIPGGNALNSDNTIKSDIKGDLIWFPPNFYTNLTSSTINNHVLLNLSATNKFNLSNINNNTGNTKKFLIDATNISAFGDCCFNGNGFIKSISAEITLNNITAIKKSAFRDLTALTNINLNLYPNISYIGEQAFQGCRSARCCSMNNLTQLTSLPGEMFYGCYALSDISLPSSITEISSGTTFIATDALKEITFGASGGVNGSDNKTLSNDYFTVTSGLSDIIKISGSNGTISENATNDQLNEICFLLKNTTSDESNSDIITILRGTLPFNTFNNISLDFSTTSTTYNIHYRSFCYSVENKMCIVSLKTQSRMKIHGAAFAVNYNLSNLYLANGTIIYINDGEVFSRCKGIKYLTIEDNISCLDGTNNDAPSLLSNLYDIFAVNESFSSLVDINLLSNNTIKFIPPYMCDGNNNLTSITLPNSIIDIERFAFRNCSNISSITIPASTNVIEKYAFNNCTGLTSVSFNENSKLQVINNSVFENCTNLSNINLNVLTDLTAINDNAFKNCSSLLSIYIPTNVQQIGKDAFINCSSLLCVYVDQYENDNLLSYLNYAGIEDINIIQWKSSSV